FTFDILRLIDYNIFPLDLCKVSFVTQDQRICGDNNIVLLCLLYKRWPGESFGSMMNLHGQRRCETLNFTLPVADDRHRTNQKGWIQWLLYRTIFVVPLVQQKHYKLNGFSQAHVVCQTTTKPELPEKCQPGDSSKLIRT